MKALPLYLTAAALVVSFAGAALAEGMCGWEQQTVQADQTVVASVPAPTPPADSKK